MAEAPTENAKRPAVSRPAWWSSPGFVAWALWGSIGAVVMGLAAYSGAKAFVARRADDNIRHVLLTHRGLHHYIQRVMHPAYFAAREKGMVSPDWYSPMVLSSSYIVRNMHGFYNQERVKDGHVEIYYKMATDNPRNPVNKATPLESGLLRKFNEQRGLREYRETVEIEGKPFLLHAMPFLETNGACLRCHGRREDAPPGLQALYPGEGGFNERAGVIRAVEIIRAPLSPERFTVAILTASAMGGLLGLAGLLAFNVRLRRLVEARTSSLREEVLHRAQVEREVLQLNATLEGRVRERTAQLQAAIQELDAFAYSVSHDLRAPLRAMDGFSSALEEDWAPALGEEGKEFLRRIRKSCSRMGDLIEDLLRLSRFTRQEMDPKDLDLSALAREVAEELRSGSPERRVVFEIEEGLAARGDESLVRALLGNLLGNAFKFTAKVPEARIEVGKTSWQGRATFFVRDNGVGFDMAYKDKLFGAFQRLHSAEDFPGTGIGLATVLRIVQRHGGTVDAASVPGRGATFYFTL
ncbi:MAG: DUF3365 domain-containing protein [Acidobacteria bacterium]|nr:DUF3365 domain-containing protein [Acidobacteriota bacterium]